MAVKGYGDQTYRVQLELPLKSKERLDTIKERTEATSYAEVIKEALRLYEAVINEATAGRTLHLSDEKGAFAPYHVLTNTQG